MKNKQTKTVQSLTQNKILKNKFRKDMQDHYTENYKTQMREISETVNKWRIITMFKNTKTHYC